MTHRLLVQYGRPTDPAEFDRYYRDVHTPLALTLPGLRSLSVGRPSSLDGSDAPYLVAMLDFESAEAMGTALQSPEGGTTAADLPNFASGGVSLSHFAVEEAAG